MKKDDSFRRKALSSIKMRFKLDAAFGADGYAGCEPLVPPASEVLKPPEKPKPAPSPPAPPPEARLEVTMSLLKKSDFTDEPLPVEERVRLLAELAAEIKDCRRCDVNPDRLNAVPGEGAPDARVMFVGEAPGRDEDIQGRPFVGRAGKMLTDIIEKGMRLARSDVYIANVLKCRPPGNRTPTPLEASVCGPYLERQIEIIRPAVICALGAVAARYLLDVPPSTSMRVMRQQVHDYRGIPVVVTYHPSYLLRNPAAKKDVWKDIQEVMRIAGIERGK